ncbi:MAG: hypothetical protein ACYTGZ_15220 [Planctomycetota bacterium]|jgi:Ca2+-binding EF-hand superfamily protein
MKLSQLLHGLLALAVVASFAAAQDGGEATDRPVANGPEAKKKGAKEKKAPRGNPVMKALDTDADQVISADELSKAPASLLALDKNKDGKLERTELGGRERPRREAGERPAGKEGDRVGAGLMGRFDTDGDGKLSKEEAPGPMKERFDEMDKNSDGFVDEKELAELHKGRGEAKGGEGGEARPERKRGERPEGREGRERPQGQRGRRGMRGGERRPPQPGSGLMRALDTDRNRELSADEIKNATASLKKLDKNNDGQLSAEETTAQRRGRGDWFARLDKDGDGKISKEEAPGRMKERFDDMDTNGDGFIDKKEQEELMERFRGGRGGRGGEGRRGRKEKEDDEEKSEE